MTKPITNWFACEACDKPRTDEELSRGPEPYEESYFCSWGLCDKDGDLDRCHRCEDVYKVEDLTNGGEYDPSNNYCHDCLISEAEDRSEARREAYDYRTTN